jgi:hypothetical protein
VIRHPLRRRWTFPVTVLLHLPGRGPQRCVGSSIVPCPGFPFRASGAVSHRPTFSTPGTAGASQGLRRLSSCMPRPEDSGGPAPPRHSGWARVAFGSVQTLGVRSQPCRSCTSTSGCAVTPTAYRMLCLRFAHLVRRAWGPDSAMDARLDTGGWLARTRQGLSPGKRRQAFLARQRQASGAANGRSEAEAIGGRLQAVVRWRSWGALTQ